MPTEDSSGALVAREHAALTALTTRWFEAQGELLVSVKAALEPGEAVLCLLQGAPVQSDVASAWLLVTTRHAALIETTQQGQVRHTGFAPQEIEQQLSAITRDKIFVIGTHRLSSPRLNKRELRRAVELASMRPVERLISAAREHFEAGLWPETAALLLAASRECDRLEGAPQAALKDAAREDVEDEARPFSSREVIALLRARLALARGNESEAVSHLEELTRLRPEDDLVESTRHESKDSFTWWLLLTLAHEGAQDHACAATVYGHLAAHPDGGPSFRLQQARALAESQQLEQAQAAYQAFIDVRLAAEDFQLTSLLMQQVEDLSEAGADPQVVAACMELGALCERQQQWERACATYLTLVCQAPFNTTGYERLFAMEEHLVETPQVRQLLGQAAALLSLLAPARAQALAQALGAQLPAPPTPHVLPPVLIASLGQASHDEQIVHEGERATASLAQRWVGDLISDLESTRDIERHCQQVSARHHPELAELIARVANFLDIPTPRCFLSHGFTGIQVMGHQTAPFLLLGAGHLDEDHAQYLSLRRQCFAVAAEIEHIRAGHLVLTSSEFWGSFRASALTGASALLSLVPIGGMLGKLADGVAGGLLGKLGKSWENATFQKAISFTHKKISDGGAADGIQTAYDFTLGKAVALGQAQQGKDQESLLKEQLADFARCAMYTADRMGLLLCDSLEDAVAAILLLSPRTAPEVLLLREVGLESLLQKREAAGGLVHQELAMRLGELFKFALSTEYAQLREQVFISPGEAWHEEE